LGKNNVFEKRLILIKYFFEKKGNKKKRLKNKNKTTSLWGW